jgi:hypothetical protein
MVETGGGGGGIPTVFILAPVILFGIGIIFLFAVARDERGPDDPAKAFMSRANHPLRHVQASLNADRKRARKKALEAARSSEAETGPGAAPGAEAPTQRRQRPNWLRRV